MKFWIIILLTQLCFFSCKDNVLLTNSEKYQKEELIVYKQLMDQLIDSVGFEEQDTVKLVFFLSDTLVGERNWQSDDDLIKDDLIKRPFSIKEINESSLHKFIRTSDTLKLSTGDKFSGYWINLSRVRFDKELAKGFLRVDVWCGNLCSWTDSYSIQKQEGQWIIVGVLKGPPS